MGVCDVPLWKMRFISDDGDSEDFVFKNIRRITGTKFTGEVWDKDQATKLSALAITCEDLGIGNPLLTRLTFLFRLPARVGEVGIFLAGVGFFPPASTNAQFRGRYRAFTPDAETPVVDNAAQFAITFDVGDTGTGNGMQAQE